MSEMVHYKGKLKKIEFPGMMNIEDVAAKICTEQGHNPTIGTSCSTYQSYQNYLEDNFGRQYVVVGNSIYEVLEQSDYEDNRDIFNAHKNDDGTISYEVKYYNGGCGFDEAIGYAIKNIGVQ